MKTLGVDLASAAERTATCLIEWAGGRAFVRELEVDRDDDDIASLAARADAVGIDAPFGWPARFVELLAGKAPLHTWTPEHRATDAAAHERTLEVHPAAALRRWGLVDRSYKGAKRRAALVELAGKLRRVASWLDVPAEHEELLRSSDDAFDAMVASLVVRAAKVGLADESPDDSRTRSEGWIVLPKEGSLSALAT